MLCIFVCDREKKTETEKESNRETKTSERESQTEKEREVFLWCVNLVFGVCACVDMCVCMYCYYF